MILEHYSANPVVMPFSRAQDTEPYNRDKPNGFWVSVKGDDDWPSWCRSEEFGINRLSIRHDVKLADNANIVTLDSPFALDDFSDRFRVEGYAPWRSAIDWCEVAELYDGIIIAPYHWSRRMSDSCGWYYGWDCASGCIWSAEAIASVTIAETVS